MRLAISKLVHPRAPAHASHSPSPCLAVHLASAGRHRHRSFGAHRSAAGLRCLHRRTRHRPVGAEDTAVTRLGPKCRAAVDAPVKVDARVQGHLLLRHKAASGTGENRAPNHWDRDAVAGGAAAPVGNWSRRLSALCANTRLSRCGNSVLPRSPLSWCMSSRGRGGPGPLHVASGP